MQHTIVTYFNNCVSVLSEVIFGIVKLLSYAFVNLLSLIVNNYARVRRIKGS
jgi:hypothetical protein